MKTTTAVKLLHIVGCFLLFTGCGKEYLAVKQNKRVVTPHTIADYQAMLDNTFDIMNSNSTHELGIIGSDEFYIAEALWNKLKKPYQKNAYVWADEVYEGITCTDWNTAYQRILYANMALEGMATIAPSAAEEEAWKNVKGSALFFRAFNFYQLAQEFCKPFDQPTSDADLGIPLRLESDVNLPVKRSSLRATYEQIIHDLNEAEALLPDVATVEMRPSRAAVYALLARVYLNMTDYEQASAYAERCLAIRSELIDFNDMEIPENPTDGTLPTLPFPAYGVGNPEVLFICFLKNIPIVDLNRLNMDTTLLASYGADDLRKEVYYFEYRDRKIFKGSYLGSLGSYFTGLALDEVYLIAAESCIRLGRIDEGTKRLNELLRDRFQHFKNLSFDSNEEALEAVLIERRKELILRGTRWEDLRRLNKEPAFSQTLFRQLGDQVFKLEPNSKKYVWPIPSDVIAISHVEQNER